MKKRLKRIYSSSKWLHRWFGLLFSIMLIFLSVSGILLNHPELISDIAVPAQFVPEQYHPTNWNRSMLNSFVYAQGDSNTLYVGGKQGVWVSKDNGRSFDKDISKGFPKSYGAKVTHLNTVAWNQENWLLACTFSGLYIRNEKGSQWKQLPLSHSFGKVIKTIQLDNRLLAVTDSEVLEADLTASALSFSPRTLLVAKDHKDKVSLISVFFDIHSGMAWGISGKLFMDFMGILIIFLSVSGIYTFWFKEKVKWRKRLKLPKKKYSKRAFQWNFHWHNKIGFWIFGALIIIGGTGLFMRPPLIVALWDSSIDASLFPRLPLENRFTHTIRNAVYLPHTEELLLDTKEGLWKGQSNLLEPFSQTELPVDIFVMGATIMEASHDNHLIVGSFYGLYDVDMTAGKTVDILTGETVVPHGELTKPGEFMPVGLFLTNDGDFYLSDFRKGVLPLNKPQFADRFQMPDSMLSEYRMPLWNYMFELHNGRLFEGIFKKWTILLIPLTSLFFLLISFTGLYDYLYIKKKWFKQVKKEKVFRKMLVKRRAS